MIAALAQDLGRVDAWRVDGAVDRIGRKAPPGMRPVALVTDAIVRGMRDWWRGAPAMARERRMTLAQAQLVVAALHVAAHWGDVQAVGLDAWEADQTRQLVEAANARWPREFASWSEHIAQVARRALPRQVPDDAQQRLEEELAADQARIGQAVAMFGQQATGEAVDVKAGLAALGFKPKNPTSPAPSAGELLARMGIGRPAAPQQPAPPPKNEQEEGWLSRNAVSVTLGGGALLLLAYLALRKKPQRRRRRR